MLARGRIGDAVALALLTLLFLVFLHFYAFSTPSEYDTYLVAIGLWDGHQSGLGAAGARQYGPWFGFGYPIIAYALGSAQTFTDGEAIVRLMGAIGTVASVATLPLAWLAAAAAYGRRAAWAAMPIFVASPVFLEIAGGQHPMLLALAFLLAGTALLWSADAGPYRWLRHIGACLLLAIAATIRLEAAFAFPLVVLASGRPGGWGALIRRALLRLPATVGALVLFFIARRLVLGVHEGGQASDFIGAWYDIGSAPRGVMFALLACGLVSILLAAVALARLLRPAAWQGAALSAAAGPLALAGPIAGAATTLLLWLANPTPGRHFLLMALAVALIVAIWVAVRFSKLDAPRLFALGLAVAVANQAAAALVMPLSHKVNPSQLLHPMAIPVATQAGDALTRRAILKDRGLREAEFANRIAAADCEKDVVVVGKAPPFILAFLRTGQVPELASVQAGDIDLEQIRIHGRTVSILKRFRASAGLQEMLDEPRFAGSTFFLDPLELLANDKVTLTQDRYASLDCGKGAAR